MAIGRMFMVLLASFSLIGSTLAQQTQDQPGPPECFTITDLGPVIEGAYDLNASGTVVGQTDRWDATLRGFVYEKRKISPLLTPTGGTSSAQGVNSRGQIVGAATLPGGNWYPVMWQKGKMINLDLFGGTWGIAQGINDNGDVVSCIDGRVVAWIRGQSFDLAIPNASFMWPAGINNLRQIAATEWAPHSVHAFLYRGGAWNQIDVPRENNLPAGNTLVSDINERGEVCGQGMFGNGTSAHAFIYDGTNWIDFDPTFQWWWSTCTGLNDLGQAVGEMGQALGRRAFLRRNAEEGMLDLNSMIPPDSGLMLYRADKINGRGQITAFASMQDGTHAILLTPMACGNRCAPPPSNLIAWWPGEGNAKDVIGGSKGLLQGVKFAPAVVRRGFVFDSFDEYIEVPDSPGLHSFNTQVTVMAWINPEMPVPREGSGYSEGWIFAHRDPPYNEGISLWVNSAGNMGASLQTTVNWVFSEPWAPMKFDGNWKLIAMTADTQTGRVAYYLNGVLLSEDYPWGLQGGQFADVTHLYIGQEAPNGNMQFRGMMDEIQLFNRSLDPSEITTIYQAGMKGACRK
jgi:hypothetical protein